MSDIVNKLRYYILINKSHKYLGFAEKKLYNYFQNMANHCSSAPAKNVYKSKMLLYGNMTKIEPLLALCFSNFFQSLC